MSTWIIISWICVAILTAVNVVVFLKLKQASEQMMKMAFPGAKNMNEAMTQMQKMLQGMPKGGPAFQGRRGGGGSPFPAPQNKNMDAQLKAAMDMLSKMQKGAKR